MDLEAIKTLLTETAGADQAAKVVESLSAFVEKAKKDAVTEAEKSLKAKIDEAVKEERVRLETVKLQELEKAKAEADKKITEEVTKYETILAKKVKSVLEAATVRHGEATLALLKESTVAKGSKLLNEVSAIIAEAKAEIDQAEKADPKEIAALTAQVTKLTEELAAKDKAILEQKARANVDEQTAKTLRESIDTKVTVTVTEGVEATKGKPAAKEHADSTGANVVTEGTAAKKPAFSPEMERMRRVAGITGGKK